MGQKYSLSKISRITRKIYNLKNISYWYRSKYGECYTDARYKRKSDLPLSQKINIIKYYSRYDTLEDIVDEDHNPKASFYKKVSFYKFITGRYYIFSALQHNRKIRNNDNLIKLEDYR